MVSLVSRFVSWLCRNPLDSPPESVLSACFVEIESSEVRFACSLTWE